MFIGLKLLKLIDCRYCVVIYRRENKTLQQNEIVKIQDTSSITKYRVKNAQTVYEVLKKLV